MELRSRQVLLGKHVSADQLRWLEVYDHLLHPTFVQRLLLSLLMQCTNFLIVLYTNEYSSVTLCVTWLDIGNTTDLRTAWHIILQI